MRARILNASVTRQLVACTVAYPLAYLVLFIVLVKIKGFVSGAGTGTYDMSTMVFCPLAFLVLGYLFGGWAGLFLHLIPWPVISRLFAERTAQIVEVAGDRGYSYARAIDLPLVFLCGWIISALLISQRELRKRTERSRINI
jgi:hypothetical protein